MHGHHHAGGAAQLARQVGDRLLQHVRLEREFMRQARQRGPLRRRIAPRDMRATRAQQRRDGRTGSHIRGCTWISVAHLEFPVNKGALHEITLAAAYFQMRFNRARPFRIVSPMSEYASLFNYFGYIYMRQA